MCASDWGNRGERRERRGVREEEKRDLDVYICTTCTHVVPHVFPQLSGARVEGRRCHNDEGGGGREFWAKTTSTADGDGEPPK